MIMTQFIDSKTKSSGKLEETRPRTDFGRHRYMETETRQTGDMCRRTGDIDKFSLSGGAPCHPSPLDPEPAPSGVVTQTARADMFMASSEIKIYLCINNEKF